MKLNIRKPPPSEFSAMSDDNLADALLMHLAGKPFIEDTKKRRELKAAFSARFPKLEDHHEKEIKAKTTSQIPD